MKQVYVTIHLTLSVLLLSLPAWAGPGRTTYQAKIIKPDGLPLEASNINFKFTILDPAGACILYSETFSAVNMSSTGGLISFSLGSGVKTYPVSATTFEQVFSNITSSLSCDTGGPASYSPSVNDIRKIVMQFHDGSGWQTLPAMSINAVPYAMYANEAQKLNGLTSSDFVQISTVPTCAASEALKYTGAGFSCIAVGSGSGGSVTSGSVITALGYTPADGASVTAVTSTVFSVSSTVNTLSSTVASLSATVSSLVSATTIQSLNGSTSGTQSFAIGTGGTAPSFNTSNGVHTLSIPYASAGSVTAGLLSNADYTVFSNKISATSAAVIAALGYTPANSATVASSQWSTSGSDIYYNVGHVGIGTTSPDFGQGMLGSNYRILGIGGDGAASNFSAGILDLGNNRAVPVNGDVLGRIVFSSQNINGVNKNRANISSVLEGVGGANGFGSNLRFSTTSNNYPSGALERMRIDSSGNIGIGLTTPVTKLDVSGGVRIGAETTTCAPALAGTLRYNSGNVEYCNGMTWSAFGVSGAGLQSLNGSISGTQIFATGTGGTAPNFVTTNGTHTFHIPYASAGAVTAGLISNADYLNFSNKMNTTSAAVITALGYTPVSSTVLGSFLQISSNLSDIASSAIARINLGLGLLATKSQIDLSSTDVSGTLSVANLADSGVTAATYTKVTVDIKGRVTSGSQFSAADIITTLGYTPANSATVASSQWNTSGTTINYMAGNVGIGTISPSFKLEVSGSATSDRKIGISGIQVLYLPNQSTHWGSMFLGDGGGSENGESNTGVGIGSLYSNTYGSYNTANGKGALYSNTYGNENTATGNLTLQYNTIGSQNTAFGNYALRSNNTGDKNTATGNSALYSNTTGNSNVANGSNALNANRTKSESTAIGYYSMAYADSVSAAVTPSYNTAIGAYSLRGSAVTTVNTGTRNTALGHSSLRVMTSGSSNTAVGYNAGSALTTGNNNVIIGSDAGSSIATLSNYVLIADGAGNRRVTIDNSGSVGIGTTTPFTKLSVSGGVQISMESATCAVNYAGTLRYNSGSVEFCNSSAWTAFGTGSVTSASVISALGYTPANDTVVTSLSSTVATSFTTLTSNINSVSSSVSSLATSTAASFAAMTPSQWNTSGTAINYMAGNVGIGTANPTNKLDVNGSMTVGWPNLASVPANSLIVNNRIGVGVANPSYALQVFGPFSDPVALFAENAGSTNGAAIQISASESGAKLWEFRTGGSASVGGLGALTFTNKTDGKTALTILPAGNVGVGTNNPLAPLHILDNSGYGIKLTRTTAPTQNFGLRIDSDGVLLLADWTTGFGLLQRSTGNNEIVTNTNPLDPSNIGNPLNYQLSIRNTDSITGNGAGIAFSDSSSNGNAGGAILFKRNGSNSVGELQFYTKQSTVAGAAPSQVMVLTNTGNVGIGTTTPSYKLEVHNIANGATRNVASFQSVAATRNPRLSLTTTNTESGTMGFSLQTDSDAGVFPNLLLNTSGGNVGIGTTSLYSTFQVKTGANQNVGIEGPVGAASGSTLNIFNDTHSANVPLEIRSSATYLGLVGGSNVGIGTTTPGYKLDVNGTIRGFGITDSSDIRLKKNVMPLDLSLEKILQIEGVSYNWIDKERSAKKQIGFIAQQLEKIYPELVETDNKGMKSVNYSHLVTPLVEAVKSLYYRIVGIEERNNNQERQIASADAKIKQLEEKVAKVDKLEAENEALKTYLCSKDPAASICK